MNDIEIDVIHLEKLINTIDQDVSEINESLTNINNTLKQLDKSKWFSLEKDKIDSGFMVYINDNVKIANQKLKEPLLFLKASLEKYKYVNNMLEKDTRNLGGGIDSVG